MKIVIVAIFLVLIGCHHHRVSTALSRYDIASQQVSLGDTKDQVLSIMQPVQETLARRDIKQPDKYIKDNTLVEIYYFRSGLQSDGLTTDDEFTPYIFNDGKLVGVGWQMLGGPKSQGQTRQTTNINVHQNRFVY